ncbi:MAG: dethiobiotin synthase [Nitrospira sp.]|nr:MAG: dethiobiotin synthase [Nitrospira sp.]
MRQAKQLAAESTPRGVFVTATDTGVGKTLVASALVKCLTQCGIDVGVMKPIETGVSQSTKARSDGARLRKAAGTDDPHVEVSPYVFRLPAAPFSAAQAEGKTVQMATILRTFRTLRQKHTFMVVEGVGGIYVPITETLNVSDLIYKMKLSVIVVGRSGVGGINHALLTLHALRDQNIPVVALVLNQQQPVRTKIARAQEESTVNLLRQLAGVPVVGPLLYTPTINRSGDVGLIDFAKTEPMTELVNLVLASGRGTISRRD